MTAYLMVFGVISMLITFPIYFTLLLRFQNELRTHMPAHWASARSDSISTPLQTTYKLLRNRAALVDAGASGRVLHARDSASKALYTSAGAFLFTLASGLAEAIIAKS